MTAWTTTSSPVDSSMPAASQPRIIGSCSALMPTPAQRPQVVVVQARGLHRHARPALRRLGIGALADDQAGQRVVGVDGLGVDGAHPPTLASRGLIEAVAGTRVAAPRRRDRQRSCAQPRELSSITGRGAQRSQRPAWIAASTSSRAEAAVSSTATRADGPRAGVGEVDVERVLGHRVHRVVEVDGGVGDVEPAPFGPLALPVDRRGQVA